MSPAQADSEQHVQSEERKYNLYPPLFPRHAVSYILARNYFTHHDLVHAR